MKPSAQASASSAKAGWLVAGLLLAWLLFLFLPRPADEETPKPPPAPAPSTSLTRAGLPDYTDWVGLPEIFAVWADRAEWKDGKTRFAYWHPVMKNYSYHFEASRVEGGYRFREIAEPREPDHFWDESLGDECPIRFYRTAPKPEVKASGPLSSPATQAAVGKEVERLPVEISAPKLQISPAKTTPGP